MTIVLMLLVLLALVGAIVYDYWYNLLPQHREAYWTDETPDQIECRAARMRENIRKGWGI